MRLSEMELIAGLQHSNVFVRDTILDHFEDAKRAHVEVTRATIAAIDRYGWENALLWPHRIASCELDDESLLWGLDQIERTDESRPQDNMRLHLARMVRNAPIEILEPHLGRIFGNDVFNESFSPVSGPNPTAAERLKRRLEVWEHDPDRCWELLHEHCDSLADVATFDDADIPYAELLVERIASAGKRYEPDIVAELQDTDSGQGDPREWLIGVMIILAGHIRSEAAIPHLLEQYEVDWDWYNEEIMYALVRIGTESVHRFVSDFYNAQPWYVRNYLVGVLENVHHDNAIECILPLIDKEDDDFLRGQLGLALASHFDDRSIEPARDLYFELPEDRERDGIVTRLFALACLADVDLPEKDDWGRQIEDDWREFERRRHKADKELIELARRLDAAKSPPPRIHPPFAGEPEFAVTETFVRETPRVGRNDPCPCGSGKKYKKCCLRSKIS